MSKLEHYCLIYTSIWRCCIIITGAISYGGSSSELVVSLTHSKSGKIHNLSGIMPTAGIVQANVKATADYIDGDDILVNSETYTMTQGSFSANIPAVMLFDTEAKTVTIGNSRESGDKMVQQLELPMSLIYEDTSSEKTWETSLVTEQPDMTDSYYDETTNIIYCAKIEGNVIKVYEQNATTLKIIINNFPQIVNARAINIVKCGDKLYVVVSLMYKTGANSQYDTYVNAIYKMNSASKTWTHIITGDELSYSNIYGTSSYASSALSDFRTVKLSENQIGIFCKYYSYSSNVSTGAILATQANTRWWSYNIEKGTITKSSQLDSVTGYGDNWWGTANLQLYPFKQENATQIFILIKALAVATGYDLYVCNKGNLDIISKTSFPAGLNGIKMLYIQGTQIADKCLYIANTATLGGKFTGEIDLFTGVINSTKYPDIPSGASIKASNRNTHLIINKIITQNISKTYTLKLVPVLPQNKPIYLKLFKGDKYSAPFCTTAITVLALSEPTQPAFTITNMQQEAVQDLEIHDCQYNLQGSPTQILVEKK